MEEDLTVQSRLGNTITQIQNEEHSMKLTGPRWAALWAIQNVTIIKDRKRQGKETDNATNDL